MLLAILMMQSACNIHQRQTTRGRWCGLTAQKTSGNALCQSDLEPGPQPNLIAFCLCVCTEKFPYIGGVLGCCEPSVRPGTGTGGALTGGLALEEDPDDVGAGDSFKDLGAALYLTGSTGLAFAAGPRTGAGGGAGVSALGRYVLVLLTDRLRVRPTFL